MVDKGPRAIGLLELPPKGKPHLIPIAIMVDGEFYDASAYKAAPVPMALYSGTVYEAQRTGLSLGLFTVSGALESENKNWMAEGTWETTDALKARAVKKPEAKEPLGLDEDEGPPKLRRAPSEAKSSAGPTAADKTPAASGTGQNSSAPGAASSQSQPAPAQRPPSGPPQQSSAAPAPASSGSASTNNTGSEDAYHPVLHRGKPTAEELKKQVEESGETASDLMKTTAGGPASVSSADTVQIVPAISDAHGPEARPYTYILKPDEEKALRQKILALASVEVRARDEKLAAEAGQSSEPARTSAKGKPAKPSDPVFEDVQLRVFDLFSNNEPELVLMAKGRMPNAASERQYMVTVVAHEDIYGDLHKALAVVTDQQHLDVIPRLELIDAVDADGDGRGELLFRRASDVSSAYVIYRVIGDQLWPLFEGTL